MHLKKMNFFDEVSPDSVIVDVGCGDGNMLKTLSSKGYRKLYGFDIKIPRVYDKRFQLKKGTMLNMPYPKGFADVLICFNSMHHLLNYRQYDLFLKNVKRVLKNGGKFFMVEPQRNIFRKLQDLIIKIPIISDVGIVKERKIVIQEERKELEKFLNIDIVKLFKSQGFDIYTYRSYLKSFILYCYSKPKRKKAEGRQA